MYVCVYMYVTVTCAHYHLYSGCPKAAPRGENNALDMQPTTTPRMPTSKPRDVRYRVHAAHHRARQADRNTGTGSALAPRRTSTQHKDTRCPQTADRCGV